MNTKYKYKVFIVDDEPISIQLISNIIKMYCPEIEIVGSADNVLKCLEKLKTCEADILISDIRMPGLSGIDLISKVKQLYPDILNIFVSGYREFEYAKAAMKLEVEDYLLKPIVPSEFKKTIHKAEEKLDILFQKKRTAILYEREQLEDDNLEKYFPHEKYYVAIIRKNGLPKRFIGKIQDSIFKNKYNMVMNGRDVMESFYLVPEDVVSNGNIRQIMKNTYIRESQNAGYTTMILSKKSYYARELGNIYRTLCKMLDFYLVIGKSQILYLEDCEDSVQNALSIRGEVSKLEWLLENKKIEQAKAEIICLGNKFRNADVTQRETEKVINLILALMNQHVDEFSWNIQNEVAMEEILCGATNINDIFMELSNLLNHAELKNKEEKLDSSEFIEKVKEYIVNHLSEDLSLKNTSKKFGISQTYLGQLFNKYQKVSFSNYIIEMRIQRAKELLDNDKEILIKDVAKSVGYQDQFYFSRVFRSMTGITPTDYINKGEK